MMFVKSRATTIAPVRTLLAGGLLLLGACLGQMNRPLDAITAFQAAALEEPDSAAIHNSPRSPERPAPSV